MTENKTNYSPMSRVVIESLIGYSAGFMIAPLITIVDKAIVQNASGTRTILIKTPIQFIKSPEQLWLFTVYGNTYACANTVEGFCRSMGWAYETPKFWIVFFVNMGLSIAKDRALVRLFGQGKPQPVPAPSFALWALRDGLTVLCAFIVPKRASKFLKNNYDFDEKTTMVTATFWTPILLQLFSSPLHLLGLDFYNNKLNTFAQRMQFLRKEYLKTSVARMARMTPAYGFGGVFNLHARNYFFQDQKKL